MPAILTIASVWKSYEAGVPGCRARVAVLRGATLAVSAGEIVCLAGPPGAGKSTLIHLAAGASRPDAGAVSWDLAPGRRWPGEPARPAVCPRASAVLDPTCLLNWPADGRRSDEVTARARFSRVADVVPDAVGDAALLRLPSGRRLLLWDLPSAVGPAAVLAVARLLGTVRRTSLAVLIATADAEALAGVATRTVVLREGRLWSAAAARQGGHPRKRVAARASASSPLARARASTRSTCGRRRPSPQ